MPHPVPERAPAFNHIPVRTESRLLIQSACKTCGTAKLVSVHDGSLQSWENTHQCRKRPTGQISQREVA